MVVIFRLKRRFFMYKFYITFTLLFITVIICFRILEMSYNFFIKPNYNCQYHEPIDVVYTWVNGSDPLFLRKLNNYLNREKETVTSLKQRYDDKYELKFSLRSLEKFAPWIHHVYIVTNGQIPYWLNLDYEKVSVVTHEEIFRDTINLPSFSSPAIECNLHRIPGLSEKFIYFNDDIFLSAPTHREDFFDVHKGYLIYLAWPIPNCAPNCLWLYVADGQCDKDCFRPECQMDGGDCSDLEGKKELPTEDLERNEDETIKLAFADTVNKNRSDTSNKSSLKQYKVNNTVVKLYNIKNVTDVIYWHNKMILKKDRLKRIKRRKRRKANLHNGNSNKPMDAYSASLQHTNRMLNSKYGYKVRKVPSHSPIFIDKKIMNMLQSTFANEFAVTERNRIRKGDDIQFSFIYYYYVISELIEYNVEKIFDDFDTDTSSTWSDREIRTLLTKLYELPLSYATVDHFEAMLLNCSENEVFPEVSTPPFERYVDSRLPTISKILVTKCPALIKILKQKFGSAPRFNYEIVSNVENKYVHFKMLNSNISDIVNDLDDIRSNRKKFVCLNDNLDESKGSGNELVKAILYDFYMSLFPHPSKFELPDDFRNKFTHISDLEEWKSYRYRVKLFIYFLIIVMSFLTILNFCKKKCCHITNKLIYSCFRFLFI